MTLSLEPEHSRILIESDPETYVLQHCVWGERGWLRVTLSRIDQYVLADLIYESGSRVAPRQKP